MWRKIYLTIMAALGALPLIVFLVPTVWIYSLFAGTVVASGEFHFARRSIFQGGLEVKAIEYDGIVMLKVNDGSPVIDTRASVYQNFSVIILDPEQFIFLSSDIGDLLFYKRPHGPWTMKSLCTDISPDREFSVMVTDHSRNPLSDSKADFSGCRVSALSSCRGVFANIGESTDLAECWANWMIVSLRLLNPVGSSEKNLDLPPRAVFVIKRKGEKQCYRNDAMRFAFPVNYEAKFADWTVKDGRAVAVTILSEPPQTVNLE